MNKDRQEELRALLHFLMKKKKSLVIDADTHISDLSALGEEQRKRYESTVNYYQGKPINAELLIWEMNMSGVDMSLCWLNPAVIEYKNSADMNYEVLKSAISYLVDSSRKYPDRIIPTGWIDPKALGMENAKRLIRECILEMGLLVIKMNPAQNGYDLDHPDVRELAKDIVSLGGIPAFHYGADTRFTPPGSLRAMAKFLYPDKLIAVHMGGGGASYMEGEEGYQETRELGLVYDNIYFIESAKRDTHIESDLITYMAAGEKHYRRIFCASDAPYGRQSWNYGGYRAMFSTLRNGHEHTDVRLATGEAVCTEEIQRLFMGENIADLLIDLYSNMFYKLEQDSNLKS